MRQQTPLQILIDKIDLHISQHKKHANKIDATALIIKNHALNLLELEHEVICGFAIDYMDQNDTAEQFYNNTFKTTKNGTNN
jgi:hypothetical protein